MRCTHTSNKTRSRDNESRELPVQNQQSSTNTATLHLRRVVPASPERVFRAWTDPEELRQWWGPSSVRCLSAEIDLRVGGRYKIANELEDGTILWIAGEYEVIERPHLLIYTWAIEPETPKVERVTVRLNAHDEGTEVILKHELIQTAALRDQHEQGWLGCLDGLVEYFAT